jgi:hypothetical protein
MALNIAALVATLQSGRQLNPAEALAIQNISSEASKEPGVARTPASGSHQRLCAFRSNDGSGQPDPHQRQQFRCADSTASVYCAADGSADFRYWGVDCQLEFLTKDEPLTEGWWQISVSDNPDQAGPPRISRIEQPRNAPGESIRRS